jgi:hypothetical protein
MHWCGVGFEDCKNFRNVQTIVNNNYHDPPIKAYTNEDLPYGPLLGVMIKIGLFGFSPCYYNLRTEEPKGTQHGKQKSGQFI